ncbi:MAG: tRNA lysidine(34) synthetase TilS [Bacteroidota bacterium]
MSANKKVEEKIFKLIKDDRLIESGDKLLIALSGGPDSVFALHFFIKFKKKYKIEIAAFHLNHMLRGKEADKDELFCEKLCAQFEVSFFKEKSDVKKIAKANKKSVEETGRDIRYNLLEKYSEEFGYNKIVTAHNLDDNAETILLNVIKGAGIKGLCGIPVKRGKIIRPFLHVQKGEILEELQREKIKFRKDTSNLSSDYERNYIRNEIIPKLKKRINNNVAESLLRTSQNMNSVSKYIDSQIELIANELISVNRDTITFKTSKSVLFQGEIRNELFVYLLRNILKTELSQNDVLKLEKIYNSQTGKSIQLKNRVMCFRERDSIIIKQNQTPKDNRVIKTLFKIGETAELFGNEISSAFVDEITFESSKNVEYICADKLSDDFVLRRWKAGDKFIPLGMKGFKKLSDFLTEQKVASDSKSEQLIVENGGEIIWVIGHRIDERYKIKNGCSKKVKLWMK